MRVELGSLFSLHPRHPLLALRVRLGYTQDHLACLYSGIMAKGDIAHTMAFCVGKLILYPIHSSCSRICTQIHPA